MNSRTMYMVNKNTELNAEIKGKDIKGKIEIANITLDTGTRQARINGRTIRLTSMEFDLLSYLAVNRNRAVSRNELLKNIWCFESIVVTRATDDMIKRLRKKLLHAGSQLKIVTVWGYGFKVEIVRSPSQECP